MNQKLLSLVGLIGAFLFPFQGHASGLDEWINNKVQPATDLIESIVFYSIPITDGIAVPIVLIILIVGASYFTFYFNFPSLRYFTTSLNILRGKYAGIEGPKTQVLKTDLNVVDGDIPETARIEGHSGEVSHFQALTAALSATVGLGNIAGVAIAIAIGGPGATFWMILAGFLGMASKFTECTLGVKYRDIGPTGTVYGGPMYYLRKGLAEYNMPMLGKFLAIFFAVMCVGGSIGGGNMFQANQAAEMLVGTFGLESGSSGFIIGILFALFTGLVIVGGIKRIGAWTERLVPFMIGIYMVAGVIILIAKFELIPEAIRLIFEGAFAPMGITGGVVGVLIQGFRRAAFSNEAGVGSAAIAHSAVKTKYPASEGMVSLMEPFIDTVVVCTMTAIIIVITNIESGFLTYGDGSGLNGVSLTATAFDTVIPHFSYILTIAVVLFAFSTMISWSYYGLQSWLYLFGRTRKNELAYKGMFLVFTIIGASVSLGAVVGFSDAMIFAMVFPNLIGVAILAPEVKKEVKRYMDAIGRLQSK
ncbi:MAG: alanine:cation symporter family protein [Saprospiraceae bacterium]|nr:alanine:cation symporter family protein [Saprospiraceae bacterium]